MLYNNSTGIRVGSDTIARAAGMAFETCTLGKMQAELPGRWEESLQYNPRKYSDIKKAFISHQITTLITVELILENS